MQDDTASPGGSWNGDPEQHPLRVLRKALGWSQDKLAEKAGKDDDGTPRLTRLHINAFEKRKNKGTSSDAEGALAIALGLPREAVRQLLDLKLDPKLALAMCSAEPIVHKRPTDGPDPYPARGRAVPFLEAMGVDKRHIDRLYTEPDLQDGMSDKDRLFWMGKALEWHNQSPEEVAKKAAEKTAAIRSGSAAYREKAKKQEAPASERPAKRRKAANE